jgi:hypothetical protein
MQRILVVGCPRSGTTLLQTLLGAHEEILTFTESHFFDQHFTSRHRYLYRVHPSLGRRIRSFLLENNFDSVPLRRPIAPGLKTVWGAAREAAICTGLFDDLAVAGGKTAWLEKTPWNFRYLPLLRRAVPDVKVVHIVRSPLANVASLQRASQAWNVEVDGPTAATVWMQAARVSIADAGRRNHLLVLYEDLVRDPEAVTRSLLRRLGFDDAGFDANGYSRIAERVITPAETWKAENRREIRPASGEEEAASLLPPDLGRTLRDSRLYEEVRRLAIAA